MSAVFPSASGADFYTFDRPHDSASSAGSEYEMPEAHDLHQSTSASMSSSVFASSASGFTINPLSVRTPRVSLVSDSTYAPEMSSSIRLPMPSDQGGLTIGEDDLSSDVDIRTGSQPPKAAVRTEDVWREIVKSSNGRDKALKVIQYSMKLSALFHTNVTTSPLLRRGRALPKWESDFFKNVDSTISGLSLARKCLILFNWLTPLSQITHPQPLEAFSALHNKFGKKPKTQQQPPLLHKVLHAPPPVLLDLFNGVCDDVATFSKLGLVGKRVGERAAKMADWCWFVATLVKLVELQVERGILTSMIRETESRIYSETMVAPGKSSDGVKVDDHELRKMRQQDYWLQISRAKLLMDLIFVSYEVFNLKPVRESAKTFTGLFSALLSAYKLYDQHTSALSKAA